MSGSDNVWPVALSDSDSESESGVARRCEGCGSRFVPTGPQRYCSHDCYSGTLRVPIEHRFWSKVNKTSSCWLWTGSTIRGYGSIAAVIDGKRRPAYAHRIAWELTHGAITDGLCVLHRCDVPLCVNPAHLFLGTQPDNLADARAKGRLVDGRGARKLSDDAYREILSSPTDRGTGIALARKYGVTETTIARIRHGRQGSTFRHSETQRLQERAS